MVLPGSASRIILIMLLIFTTFGFKSLILSANLISKRHNHNLTTHRRAMGIDIKSYKYIIINNKGIIGNVLKVPSGDNREVR